ncbi:hypothetical protein ES703_97890 [subsurface metagenome]
MNPAPRGNPYAGSFTLTWRTPPGEYFGIWRNGIDFYRLVFTYDTTTGEATASADWELGYDLDSYWYPEKTIPLPPPLLYTNSITFATFYYWRGSLLITT